MVRPLIWILRGLWFAGVLALPLLGFWLASSLAVFLSGPQWLPWLAGALAILLPMIWEVESQFRFSRKIAAQSAKNGPPPKRILTLSDRLLLRTTCLNLLFLAAMLIVWPQASFAALSTRGDWMLEARQEPWADQARSGLFRLAGGLEWLYELSHPNPYARMAEADDAPEPAGTPSAGELPASPGVASAPEPDADTDADADADPADDGQPDSQPDTPPASETAAPTDTPSETPSQAAPASSPPAKARAAGGKAPSWPLAQNLHPAVAAMPASAETSIASVAAYIGARERNPYQRVKAIYDYLAKHIAYDGEVLLMGTYPPQDAETVFRKRKGVCAGYANLFKALADELAIPAQFVVGDSRDSEGAVAGSSHAWNAVEIEGRWYLIDATWGAGYLENYKFTRRYDPAYLLTPPEIFAMDHLPDEEKWQLRSPPLARGEFARQPLLRASFFEQGYQLIEPRRSQVSVSDTASLHLKNTQSQYLMARLVPAEGGTASACSIKGSADVKIDCAIPGRGRYKVMLFSNDSPQGQFEYVGQLQVVSG